jgi:hypothetical protein
MNNAYINYLKRKSDCNFKPGFGKGSWNNFLNSECIDFISFSISSAVKTMNYEIIDYILEKHGHNYLIPLILSEANHGTLNGVKKYFPLLSNTSTDLFSAIALNAIDSENLEVLSWVYDHVSLFHDDMMMHAGRQGKFKPLLWLINISEPRSWEQLLKDCLTSSSVNVFRWATDKKIQLKLEFQATGIMIYNSIDNLKYYVENGHKIDYNKVMLSGMCWKDTYTLDRVLFAHQNGANNFIEACIRAINNKKHLEFDYLINIIKSNKDDLRKVILKCGDINILESLILMINFENTREKEELLGRYLFFCVEYGIYDCLVWASQFITNKNYYQSAYDSIFCSYYNEHSENAEKIVVFLEEKGAICHPSNVDDRNDILFWSSEEEKEEKKGKEEKANTKTNIELFTKEYPDIFTFKHKIILDTSFNNFW